MKGAAVSTIRDHLKKAKIPKRTHSEALKLAVKKGRTKRYSGAQSSNWKGGRRKHHGYILVLAPSHPNCDKYGYVFEHRVVMEQKIGRYLTPTERVHHINGIRDDNRPENLQLLSTSEHSLKTLFCQNCSLKKEIRLLRWEMRELRKQLQGSLWKENENFGKDSY